MGRLVGTMLGAYGGRALGGMVGGNTGRMIGSLAGSMLGSRGMGAGAITGSLGALLSGDKNKADDAAQELPDDDATILLQAMCNAAKADREVDQDEIDNIVKQLGPLDPDEEAMVKAELERPLDEDAFINSVPLRLANDVYTVSLLTITVDTQDEQRYLNRLAAGLGISADTRQSIHETLGITNFDVDQI